MSDTEGGFTIRPGARIGDLLLVRELGRGNQGVVWEAQQVSLGRSVAVKILPREITFVTEQTDRFHREAEAAGRLTHPNIVAVHGFDDAHGHPLMVQEFVGGGSLEKVLVERAQQRDRIDAAANCRWAAETCRALAEGLDHAHRHNVIHRDIKPGNVLLTKDGVPKLADFGLAKVSDLMDLSHTGTIMGTPHYMSPEQVSPEQAGGGGVDARSDIYSLGGLLYRMVTHEVPFRADGLQRLFNDILTREPRRPRSLQPGVPPDLEAICLKALEKLPERRYATAQDFAEDLSRFLRGEPTQARPVGPLGRAQRFVGRQSTAALAAAALLVPTAWFAVDVLLRQGAVTNVRLHDVRLGGVALAAVLLAWPLFALGTRLRLGRHWGAWSGASLALLAGSVAGLAIRDQKLTQLHMEARTLLSNQIDLENVGQRKDVGDIEGYVSGWSSRFDVEDDVLVARAYLKRERPVQADAWSQRLLAAGAVGPVEEALHLAIAAALGAEADVATSEARLRTAEEGVDDWRVWRRIGSILFDMKRFVDARAAYERAARLPKADRDRLNLDLALVSDGMCEWENAEDLLNDVMKWRPDDPRARKLALRIARRGRDFQLAEKHLGSIEADPTTDAVVRLQQRYDLLGDEGRDDEAFQFVRDSRAAAGTEPLVREWCARTELALGRAAQRRASAASAAGSKDEAAREQAAAIAWLEGARDDYEALTQAPGDSLIGRIGLCAALQRLVRYEPQSAPQMYASAIADARRAIEMDPFYYEAHYNLALALRGSALQAKGGSEAALDADDWRAIVESLVRSVQVNGRFELGLNNAAHALAMLHRTTGEQGLLDQALGLARRAAALGSSATSGACKPDTDQRNNLSASLDTLAEILELRGDLPGALEAARSSRAALLDSDSAASLRAGNVARLEALVGAAR